MQKLTMTIRLASDAEPGSGIAGGGVDQRVPRSAAGLPILQSSHIKGLLLESLRQIVAERQWKEDLCSAVFGAPDAGQSRVVVGDAHLVTDTAAHGLTISRTAVDAEGSKLDRSLRTVEAIGAGSAFEAPLWIDGDADEAIDLAVRLAALSIGAVGASRSRGAGACQVMLDGQQQAPGQLLRKLDDLLKAGRYPERVKTDLREERRSLASGDGVVARLFLVAEGPICCPERPVTPGNTIESSLAIPASAVQGLLLTLLNGVDSALASACFEDPRFRAWPLLPVAFPGDVPNWENDAAVLDKLPRGVRAPLSLRISKLRRADGTFVLGDTALGMLPANEPSPGAPLRASDGVLLVSPNAAPRFWRAVDIPRVLSTHGVHRDGQGERNLFSVISIAPLVFEGLVMLPPEGAEALERRLQQDDAVTVGKARSVRGQGRLVIRPLGSQHLLTTISMQGDEAADRTFIVQGPLALPDAGDLGHAEEALARLVADSGWGELDVERSRAELGLRFGWNRHGLGQSVGQHRRLRARRCVLPGSVIVLKEALADPHARLAEGLGPGREAGFGAVFPHPGVAHDEVFEPKVATRTRPADASGKLAFELWEKAGGAAGPSAAQVSALLKRLRRGKSSAARTFLETQRRDRPARVWGRWEPVYDDLIATLDSPLMEMALKGWQDLAAANKEQRQ